MNIRPETPADYAEIYDLIKIAFQTAQVSDGNEQNFANQLRDSGNYIPELALVAEEDGRIIGQIMLTRTQIKGEQKTWDILFAGPLAVLLDYRSRGIGSALMRAALEIARQLGYQAVALAGDPAYYHRFGYRSFQEFGLQSEHHVPDPFAMAVEITPGALQGVVGVVLGC